MGIRFWIALACLTAFSVSCGRSSGTYASFVASHDAIRPDMSMKQVLEAGLAEYLIQSDGKNIAGATLPEKTPASSDCTRHVVDLHSAAGGFSLRVYCNMNAPSNRQLVAPGVFATKRELLEGLERYASWMTSLRFRVESPALRIGGVYDSYEFVIDENGKVRSVSPIKSGS
jgi:hypothetical protein